MTDTSGFRSVCFHLRHLLALLPSDNSNFYSLGIYVLGLSLLLSSQCLKLSLRQLYHPAGFLINDANKPLAHNKGRVATLPPTLLLWSGRYDFTPNSRPAPSSPWPQWLVQDGHRIHQSQNNGVRLLGQRPTLFPGGLGAKGWSSSCSHFRAWMATVLRMGPVWKRWGLGTETERE